MPLAQKSMVEVLGRLPVLQPLSLQERSLLAPFCAVLDFSPDEVILEERAANDNKIYFLLEGQVSVFVEGRYILSLNQPGDVVGEMSLVTNEPRSATVRADKPTRALAISNPMERAGETKRALHMRYVFFRTCAILMAEKLRLTSQRAKLYEDTVLHTRQMEATASTQDEIIRHNLCQIRLFSHLIDTVPTAVVIVNKQGRVEQVNAALEAMLGVRLGAGEHPYWMEALGLGHSPQKWAAITRRVKRGLFREELALANNMGQAVPVDCTISQVNDKYGQFLAYAILFNDIRSHKASQALITEQKLALEKVNQELTLLATIDSLTGLYNRRVFQDRLQEEWSKVKRHDLPLSVVMMDVDHFKRVNDTYGHTCGDAVLRALGSLIRSATRQEDIPCRYGGEEVVIILPQMNTQQAFQAAEKLRQQVERQPVIYDAQEIPVRISLGCAGVDCSGIGGHEDLVKLADMSLYMAKTNGRNATFCLQGLDQRQSVRLASGMAPSSLE